MKWNQAQIPDQKGRIAIVTGSNTGIGFETARALAAKGADVILACRNREKAAAAMQRIEADKPAGIVTVKQLDLSDLASIHAFVNAFKAEHDHLDLLINNAGVMVPPQRQETSDGFELQFGVNHLGHFALTGLLLDSLGKRPGARVVTVSSLAHKFGRMDFEDPNWVKRKYAKWESYGQSKLANLLFHFQLDHMLKADRSDVKAVAAHPGWTQTDLQRHTSLSNMLSPLFGMKPWQGALPTLRAAVDPGVEGGEYFGPASCFELRGYPVPVDTTSAARKTEDMRKLWNLSERFTKVRFH